MLRLWLTIECTYTYISRMQDEQSTLSLSDCLEVEKSCLALNLRRVERIVCQIYDTALRPFGIKSTQFSLMVTVHAMQPAPLSRIADRINIDRTTLTRNLSLLKASGLIEISRGDDLRERMISMTKKGDAVIVAAFPIWTATQMKLTSKMGNPSVASLMSGLKAASAAAA
jgi:DNA-binding MarR family transcriptional regulator